MVTLTLTPMAVLTSRYAVVGRSAALTLLLVICHDVAVFCT